ncbi:hypothetical protein [Clostridium gallinarum]|nr:hypothetical protein [Clostridium gallinarum]
MKKFVAVILLILAIIFLWKGYNDWKYRISNKVTKQIKITYKKL